MFYYLYRKSSGEVIGASTDEAAFFESEFFGVVQSEEKIDVAAARFTDGEQIREATIEEAAKFSESLLADAVAEQKTQAKDAIDLKEQSGFLPRSLRGLAAVLLAEINEMRKDLGMEAKTLENLKTAIKAAIDSEK